VLLAFSVLDEGFDVVVVQLGFVAHVKRIDVEGTFRSPSRVFIGRDRNCDGHSVLIVTA
jgi:hypothetical protein